MTRLRTAGLCADSVHGSCGGVGLVVRLEGTRDAGDVCVNLFKVPGDVQMYDEGSRDRCCARRKAQDALLYKRALGMTTSMNSDWQVQMYVYRCTIATCSDKRETRN